MEYLDVMAGLTSIVFALLTFLIGFAWSFKASNKVDVPSRRVGHLLLSLGCLFVAIVVLILAATFEVPDMTPANLSAVGFRLPLDIFLIVKMLLLALVLLGLTALVRASLGFLSDIARLSDYRLSWNLIVDALDHLLGVE